MVSFWSEEAAKGYGALARWTVVVGLIGLVSLESFRKIKRLVGNLRSTDGVFGGRCATGNHV